MPRLQIHNIHKTTMTGKVKQYDLIAVLLLWVVNTHCQITNIYRCQLFITKNLSVQYVYFYSAWAYTYYKYIERCLLS